MLGRQQKSQLHSLDLVPATGPMSNRSDLEVQEYKIDFGPGYRVYFAYDGQALLLLLAGGAKKRQQSDIDAAKERWQDYKLRKKQRKGD